MVDDDFNITQGFKRVVHGLPSEWKFQFVGSGLEALRLMDEQPFDVIVSDMRMPGMNGAELLQIVMGKFPQVVRIIFSGYSDPAMVLRSIRPAHRFLAKPCATENVIAAISQTLDALDLVPDENLKKMAAGISDLPVSNYVYENLLRELEIYDSSLKKVGHLINRDIAIFALSLKLVSSEFLGLPQPIGIIQQVFERIGLESIKKIVLDKNVLFMEENMALPEKFPLEVINKHSVSVAQLAAEIAGRAGADGDERTAAAIGGMLHDIGKIVLFGFPGLYQRITNYVAVQQCDLCEAERQILGTTHAELGACLLGLWGLPGNIVRAVAHHHCAPKKTANSLAGTAIQRAELLAETNNNLPLDGELLKLLDPKWFDLDRIVT